MVNIVYESLSSLTPIELKYQYYKDEELENSITTFRDGYSFYDVKGFNNFQDITINRNSLFILTSAISLSQVFTSPKAVYLGKLPATIQLQPRNTSLYFVKHDVVTNTFKKVLNSASIFYVQPVVNTNEIELIVDNKFVQVDENYPYTVSLGERSFDVESINRQRFQIVNQNNLISFKTLTNSGYRYLAFNSDNTLRAVGVILSESIVNDYIFKYTSITTAEISQGFTPTNNWITYYFDVENKLENKTVTLNKVLAPTQTHLLVDLPVEKAAANGTVNINIANLKTGLTPSGGPSPINNVYEKQVITSN